MAEEEEKPTPEKAAKPEASRTPKVEGPKPNEESNSAIDSPQSEIVNKSEIEHPKSKPWKYITTPK
jgi:hypothetical protein